VIIDKRTHKQKGFSPRSPSAEGQERTTTEGGSTWNEVVKKTGVRSRQACQCAKKVYIYLRHCTIKEVKESGEKQETLGGGAAAGDISRLRKEC